MLVTLPLYKIYESTGSIIQCSLCSGYMAPEYAMRGHYSIKSDVFSFGVLMLEIVAGRRNGGSYDSEQHDHLLSLVSVGHDDKLHIAVPCKLQR